MCEGVGVYIQVCACVCLCACVHICVLWRGIMNPFGLRCLLQRWIAGIFFWLCIYVRVCVNEKERYRDREWTREIVYVCVKEGVYIQVCVYVCVRVYAHICAFMCMRVCVHLCVRMSVSTSRTFKYEYTNTCIHTDIHIYIQYMQRYISFSIHTRIYTDIHAFIHSSNIHPCIHTYEHACVCTLALRRRAFLASPPWYSTPSFPLSLPLLWSCTNMCVFVLYKWMGGYMYVCRYVFTWVDQHI